MRVRLLVAIAGISIWLSAAEVPGVSIVTAQSIATCTAGSLSGDRLTLVGNLSIERPENWTLLTNEPVFIGPANGAVSGPNGELDMRCGVLMSAQQRSGDDAATIRTAHQNFLNANQGAAAAARPKVTDFERRLDGSLHVFESRVPRRERVVWASLGVDHILYHFVLTTPAAEAPAVEQQFFAMLSSLSLPTVSDGPTAAAPPVHERQGEANIIGFWAGHKSLSMTGGFFPNWADGSSFNLPKFTDPNPPRIFVVEFRADRTYSFAFGQGDAIWTSHSGTVALSRATDRASGRYPYLLTLTPLPETLTTSPAKRAESMPPGLAELGPGPRTFRLRSVEGDGLRMIDAGAGDWLNDIGYFALYPIEQ
jgi:hypothetical protein